jgi:hypothetical protein
MSKPLIPFGVMPGHWGLKGKTRELAKAEYELDGYDLELRLCELNNTDDVSFKLSKLDLDLKYGKISSYDYDLGLAIVSNTDKQERELELAILNVDFKHGKVSQKQYDYSLLEYEKLSENDNKIASIKLDYKYGIISESEMNQTIATIKGEEWCDIRIIPDKDDPRYGSFKVDCNQLFLDKLQNVGVLAPDRDSLLDLYITDFCKSVAMPSVKDTVSILEEIRRQSASIIADSLDEIDE